MHFYSTGNRLLSNYIYTVSSFKYCPYLMSLVKQKYLAANKYKKLTKIVDEHKQQRLNKINGWNVIIKF